MDLFNMDKYSSKDEGIRLQKLEVLNWGTFDKYVWDFTPNGKTSLLTGDSGSGKSTLVDALTTLLVPPRKISYNKAADASARERNAKSYTLGYYRKKYHLEGKSKPEALRSTNTYSVILATFRNEIEDKTTTIAIFLWFRNNDSNPTKLYVVADTELSIVNDFSNFDSKIKALKNSLRSKGALLFDDYIKYSIQYRKRLGNISEQAVELFQQTISMKKVDALNSFVRESMLENDDMSGQIANLLKHYENLSVAYEAVIKAKEQFEKLTPICEKGKRYSNKELESNQISDARNSVKYWFANKKSLFLKEEIDNKTLEFNKIEDTIKVERHNEKAINDDIKVRENLIFKNGGEEIASLENEVKYLNDEHTRRATSLKQYNVYAKKLNLTEVVSISDYYDNLNIISGLDDKYRDEKIKVQNFITDLSIQIQEYNKLKEDAKNEIESLRLRNSNIASHLIKLRDRLCKSINVSKELLPFAGELLEVKEPEIEWEGAIERLLHSFAISLLVPSKYYDIVAKWVNKNSLGAKLVYFNTGQKSSKNAFATKLENTVSSKLTIKKDTVFTEWLENEISIRFSHVCCKGIEDFKREKKAITLTGQIKSNIRHEKDDRRKVDDRSRYVLGFSNEKKIRLLSNLVNEYNDKLSDLNGKKTNHTNRLNKLSNLENTVENISQFEDYEKIDVLTIENEISSYNKKIDNLKNSNDKLNTLKKQLKESEEELSRVKSKLEKLYSERGGLDNILKNATSKFEENNVMLDKETEDVVKMYGYLDENYRKHIGKEIITISNCDEKERRYYNSLTNRFEKLQKELTSLHADIVKLMANFRNTYPSDCYDMSDNISSISEYNKFLERLEYNDLPRYTESFQKELHEKTINHISIFSATLENNRRHTAARIEEINRSLHDIDYNAGRYIKIICEDTPESTIKTFKTQLKACTEGMISGNSESDLAEKKFMQIKEIIEKFKGNTDADSKWTKRVTDVRNWFIFSASERWRSNEEEYEHYSDSDGKSGGQKEKLAYTILAASLAYNYRLKSVKNRGNSFRLVVIDEAFLKSSDDSAKFGLSLFQKMNFQLLVVTPLLKIYTIEPYVFHVGLVSHCDKTHHSKILNMEKEVFSKKYLNRDGSK